MMQLSAVNICWFFLFAGSYFAVTHCAVIGDRIYTPCLPHTVACSCSDEASKIVIATVKYCDRNATQCVPCEDFKTLCFRTCREKGKVLAKVRKRRDVCNPDMPSKKGRPKVNITSGLSRTVFVDLGVLKLDCEVRSNPAANIFWLFRGKPLLKQIGDVKYDFLKCNKTLLVKQLEITDTGNYTCAAVNKFGNGSATSLVTVIPKNDGPNILSFEVENNDYAYVGGSVNLTCYAAAKNGFIYFKKFGKLVSEEDPKFLYIHLPSESDYVKTALEIRNVSFSDAGNVTCSVLDGKYNHVEQMVNLAVVPCPKGHYCPLGSNQEYRCPPGTYNDGSQNVTYNCTQCPYHTPNNTTKDGLTSVTDCQTAEGGPSLPDTGRPPNSTLWQYLLIPVGVLLVVVVALVVGWRCLWKKRRSSHASWEIELPRVIDVMDPEGSLIEHAPEVDVEVKYDAFICYSSKDTEFVQELFEELEKRGFRCCVDVRDFVVGATIVENIADAIYGSRKTLAILSPDFVKSKWCRHEIRQALARISSHLVVPILFAKCDIPPLLLDRTYLDWQDGHDKEHFWQRLVEALGRGRS